MSHSVLRLPTVMLRTGLSRSSIYRNIDAGTFPKPISLGPRTVGWLETEIDRWIERRIESRGECQ